MRLLCGMAVVCVATFLLACGSSDDGNSDGATAGNGGSVGGSAGNASGGSGPSGSGGSTNGTGGGNSSGSGGTSSSGGTSNTGGTGGSGVLVSASWTAACENAATTLCPRIEACEPFIFAIGYGDQATCVEQATSRCKDNASLEGVSASPSEYDACVDAVLALPCEEWATGLQTLPECDLTGSLPEGTSCSDDLQCTTGTCGGATINGCQQCMVLATEGQSCSVVDGPDCANGLNCDNGTCVALPAVGDPCSTNSDCGLQLNCVSGQCERMQGLNDPCSSTLRCDFFGQGLVCSPDMNQCEPATLPGLGEPCDLFCQRGTQCNFQSADPTCVAVRALGDMCDGTGAAPCADGLDCIDGTCQAQPTVACP